VGQKYKGRNIVRAKSEVVIHQSEKQQKSLSAFGKMNKLSAFLARNAWGILGLSDKTMLRHNAVASLLKPVIKDKTINFSYWTEIAPRLSTFYISDFHYAPGAGLMRVQFQPEPDRQAPDGAIIIVCVATPSCDVLAHKTAALPVSSIELPFAGESQEDFYALLFVCAEKNGAFRVIGADATQGYVV
jgi:hypothetical protein